MINEDPNRTQRMVEQTVVRFHESTGAATTGWGPSGSPARSHFWDPSLGRESRKESITGLCDIFPPFTFPG